MQLLRFESSTKVHGLSLNQETPVDKPPPPIGKLNKVHSKRSLNEEEWRVIFLNVYKT